MLTDESKSIHDADSLPYAHVHLREMDVYCLAPANIIHLYRACFFAGF